MEFLLLLLIVLGIPFSIGYSVGKSKANPQNLYNARLQGQAEVRDYIVQFLASQPANIKKTILLKELGVKKSTKEESTAYTPDSAPSQPSGPGGESWSPFAENQVVQTASTPQRTAAATTRSSEGRVLSMDKISHADKAKKDLQNINTILYVASLLIVAAAVLFVTIDKSVTNELKFFGVWLVTIGFYGAGFILHKTSQRLRPAAVAFLGTALALLPFAGLATDALVLHNPQLSWFITSALGLILFFTTTLLLKSQLLAYLTIGFVFSLATSSVAVLQMGFVWYFLLIIILASLCNLIAYINPKILPEVFRKPIDDGGQLAVPLAVFGSWWNVQVVDLWQNALVLLVTGIHYATAALTPTHLEMRKLYVFLSRLSFSIAAVLFVYDITKSMTAVGITASIVALVQIGISTVLSRKAKSDFESIWLWGGIAVLFGSIVFWYDDPQRALLTTVSLSTILLTSLAVGFSIRDARFGIVSIATLALLPLQVGFDLIHPHITQLALSLVYLVMATSFLILRLLWAKRNSIKIIAISAYALYLVLALCVAFALKASEASVVFVSASVLLLAISYIERAVYVTSLANVSLFYGLWLYVSTLQISGISRLQLTICVVAGLWYALRIVFAKVLRDQDRAQVMAVSSILTLFIGSFAYIGDSGEYGVVASCMLLVAALLIAIEGWIYKQYEYYEIAALSVMLAGQRLVAINYDMSILFYVGLWAALFYGLSILRRMLGGIQAQQLWFGLAVIVLACYSFIYFFSNETAQDASMVLFVLAGIFANEARLDKRYEFYEVAAVIATISLQKIVSLAGDYDLLLYTHWWALIAAALALGRQRVLKDNESAKTLYIIALCVLTLPTGLKALGDPSTYQLIFLVENIVLLVGGLFATHRTTVLWGASGVSLAILYWLKDQTYFLLALVGIGLIGLAIWRLMRLGDKR